MSNPSWTIQTLMSGYSASLGANTTFDTNGYMYIAYFDKAAAGTLSVAKADISSGNIIWKSTISITNGSANEDIDPIICLDSQRNVYVAFTSAQDVFVAKFGITGTYQWTVDQLSTSGNDTNPFLTYDFVHDTLYLTYETATTTPGNKDIVLTQVSVGGAKMWQRTIGTIDDESSAQLSVSPQGHIILSMNTTGSLAGTKTGISDIAIAVYDVSNNELWKKQSSSFNTIGANYTPMTIVDANENIYCAYVTTTASDGYNLEIFKLGRKGYLIWWFSDNVINTSADDIQPSLAIDAYGYLYLAYATKGTGLNNGALDVVVVKMRSDNHTSIWKQVYSQQNGRASYQPVIYTGPNNRIFVAFLLDNADGGTDIGIINISQTITDTTNILTPPIPPYPPVLSKTDTSGLSWTVPAGNVGSYKVYTCYYDTNTVTYVYTYFGETTATGLTNANLRVGTYNYAVTAVDATLGFESEYSNIVGPITVSSPVTEPYVPCFLAAAPVLTPTGYRRISKLAVGDLVRTADGRNVAIKRVIVKRVMAGPGTNPYIIPVGRFGAECRLLISPNHCVVTENGDLVEAQHLGLAQQRMSGEFDYYNVELEDWRTDHMVVAGVAVESLAPVRRVVVSMESLRRELVRKYGTVTPTVLDMLRATCRLVGEDRVSVPILPRRQR